MGSTIEEGPVLFLYATELYQSNQLVKAEKIICRAKQLYCTYELFKLAARVARGLKKNKEAETNYLQAVLMVPNRMASRCELLDFYLERKDTTKAVFWASSVLSMPVKMPSAITLAMQQKTKEILKRLYRKPDRY